VELNAVGLTYETHLDLIKNPIKAFPLWKLGPRESAKYPNLSDALVSSVIPKLCTAKQ